jgi:hypothetical protein
VVAADRDAELNWLKTLVKQLADKVNAPGDTPEARLSAVEDHVDDVALHGVRLGTTVTTPSEIISYYRLNHSIWSLSNNKEVSR